MSNRNPLCDAFIHLGYGFMKIGLYQDAIEHFSAAQVLDANDERAVRASELAHAKLGERQK